jgi:hypothetical protein
MASERRALGELEQEIADLQAQREQTLLQDDPTEAVKLSDRISALQRQAGVRLDRIAAFGKQSKRDATEQRERDKAAALAVFEKKFADRATAAARVGKAIAELSASLKQYREAARLPFEPWPDTFPALRLFQDSAYSSLESRIGGALYMRSPGAAHTLIADLGSRLGDLAEREIALGASLVEDIRTAPLPRLPEIEEAA